MNDNEINILEFPIRKFDWDADMTDEELIQNFRLSVAKLLNLKALGKYNPTFEDIKGIKIVNDICIDLGYPPILKDMSVLS